MNTQILDELKKLLQQFSERKRETKTEFKIAHHSNTQLNCFGWYLIYLSSIIVHHYKSERFSLLLSPYHCISIDTKTLFWPLHITIGIILYIIIYKYESIKYVGSFDNFSHLFKQQLHLVIFVIVIDVFFCGFD